VSPAAPRDLATKVEAIAHRYPDRRSLTLPALRFAQEEPGLFRTAFSASDRPPTEPDPGW